jgi:hypothetical protein
MTLCSSFSLKPKKPDAINFGGIFAIELNGIGTFGIIFDDFFDLRNVFKLIAVDPF